MYQYDTYKGIGPVVLFDRFGRDFYRYQPRTNVPFFFNVKPGKYSFHGNVSAAGNKMVYIVGPLEKYALMPEKIDVVFTSGSDIASLNPPLGRLTLDECFRKWPLFCVCYTLGHEVAHYIYPSKNGVRTQENEFNCDWYSAKFMLKDGWNPSQVLAAMKFVLGDSNENEYRFTRMIKSLNRVKFRFVDT